jgi:hypothetical protein
MSRMITGMRRGDLDRKGLVSNADYLDRIPSPKPGCVDSTSVCITINYSNLPGDSSLLSDQWFWMVTAKSSAGGRVLSSKLTTSDLQR